MHRHFVKYILIMFAVVLFTVTELGLATNTSEYLYMSFLSLQCVFCIFFISKNDYMGSTYEESVQGLKKNRSLTLQLLSSQ